MLGPRTRNQPGENEQISLDGSRTIDGELRWSKFHAAAVETSNRMHGMVGGGDKINALERALEAAYACGWRDATTPPETIHHRVHELMRLREAVEEKSAGGTIVETGEAYEREVERRMRELQTRGQ